MPRYTRRLASVADAVSVLVGHPDGMGLDDLAARLGVDPRDLADDLHAATLVDVVDPRVTGLSPGIAFVDDDGEWVPPAKATKVMLVGDEAFDALGLNLVNPGTALSLVETGRALAKVDRDPSLLSALDKLEEALRLVETERPVGVPIIDDLSAAIAERRKIRIVYSKAWNPSVITRVVQPLRLALVEGVWELDAGPVEHGDIRSYLVRRIRSFEVVDETFVVDDETRRLLVGRRRTADVSLVVPTDMVWLLDSAADAVTVERSDESGAQVVVTLREPIEARLGVMLAALGPEALVVDPPQYQQVAATHAARLLDSVLD